MRFLGSSMAVVVAIGLIGCEKEEQKERSAEPVASVDKAAAIDPALAKAVAQASAARPVGRGPAAATPGGPPPNGVFEPGAADREAARGSAPKITLGERGAEPRVQIGPMQPKPGWKTSGTMQVVLQQADPRQQPLPVTVTLALEAQKPKTADAGAADAAGATAGAVAVTARVKSAEVGIAGVPQEIVTRVAAMKGATLDYQVAPDGSGSGYRFDAGTANELVDYLRALSDTLALVTLPTPTVPLGAGGFWMTTTREGVYGLDLVTYRMVKVEKVTGDLVTLSVSTKRYATSPRFDFPGLGADAPRELIEFDAKSDGRLEVRAGGAFPSGGEISSVLMARLGAGQQSGVLQIQSRVGLAFAGPTAPAPKKPPSTDPISDR